MNAQRTKRTRCEKCGRVAMVRPRRRTCRRVEVRMGGRFWCGGRLVAAPIARAPKGATPKPSRRAVLEARHARAYRAEQQAVRRLELAQRAIVRWRKKVRALERQIAELKPSEAPTRAYFVDESAARQ